MERKGKWLAPFTACAVLVALMLVAYGLAYWHEFSGTTYTIDNGPKMPNYWHDGPVISALFAQANAIDRMLRPDRWAANPPTPTPPPPNVSPTPIPVSN